MTHEELIARIVDTIAVKPPIDAARAIVALIRKELAAPTDPMIDAGFEAWEATEKMSKVWSDMLATSVLNGGER